MELIHGSLKTRAALILLAAAPAWAGVVVDAPAPARFGYVPAAQMLAARLDRAASMLGSPGLALAATNDAVAREAAYGQVVAALAAHPNPAAEALVRNAVSLQATALYIVAGDGSLPLSVLSAEADELEPFLKMPSTANDVAVARAQVATSVAGKRAADLAFETAAALRASAAEDGYVKLAADSLLAFRKTWRLGEASRLLQSVSALAFAHPSPRLHQAIALNLGESLRKTHDPMLVDDEIRLLSKLAVPDPAAGFVPFPQAQETVVDVLAREAAKTYDARVFRWSLHSVADIARRDDSPGLAIRTRVFRGLVLERERLEKKSIFRTDVMDDLSSAIDALAASGVPVSARQVLEQAGPPAPARRALAPSEVLLAQTGLLAAVASSTGLALVVGSVDLALAVGALVLAAGTAFVYVLIKKGKIGKAETADKKKTDGGTEIF